MSFEDGILVCNAEGSSSDGIKTWKCLSASDTEKLINGETVKVNWDNQGLGKKMTLKDKDTFLVTHEDGKVVPFQRINNVSCGRLFVYFVVCDSKKD